MYRSSLSLWSALDGVEWSTPRPGRFTPEKEPVSMYRKLVGPQGHSGRERKVSPPPGFNPRIAHRVASRYTDCAIPAHMLAIKTFANYFYSRRGNMALLLLCKYFLYGTYHPRSALTRPNTFVFKFDTSPQFYWLTNRLEERQEVRPPTV